MVEFDFISTMILGLWNVLNVQGGRNRGISISLVIKMAVVFRNMSYKKYY